MVIATVQDYQGRVLSSRDFGEIDAVTRRAGRINPRLPALKLGNRNTILIEQLHRQHRDLEPLTRVLHVQLERFLAFLCLQPLFDNLEAACATVSDLSDNLNAETDQGVKTDPDLLVVAFDHRRWRDIRL